MAASGPELEVVRGAGRVEAQWTSRSITATAPFLHYEYQVEVSSNLVQWQNFGPLISGGARPAPAIVERVALTNLGAAAFVRLTYRLNLPGAGLAGANLAGANVSGGNLEGANLAGANFAGATIEGTKLDGALLAGVSFRRALGTPTLSVLGGPAGASAARSIPRLRYWPKLSDYPVASAALAPGVASSSIVGAALKPDATVGQFNAILASLGAKIVGSIPGPTNGAAGLVTLKLPTSESTIGSALAALQNSGLFAVTARDLLSSPAALPREQNGLPGDPDWVWGLPAGGGNWGSEIMGVPQLWNFSEAIQKSAGGHVTPVTVGVMEGGMNGHEDLLFLYAGADGSSAALDSRRHGAHVTGIIGARHENGRGVQGVSPFLDLRIEAAPGGAITAQWEADAVENLANLGAKVINISIAVPWYAGTNNPNTSAAMQQTLNRSGDLAAATLATIAGAGPLPLLCVAAGNDSDSPSLGGANISAFWASGWANAALRNLVDNVLVVESAGAPNFSAVVPGDLTRSPFSNIDGHLSAPGSQILSTYDPSSYNYLSGTSMATPQVTGVAAYLWALDPTLTRDDIKRLLLDQDQPVADGAKPMLSAWRAAMNIDQQKGSRAVLRQLLDLDDGTKDGNLRVSADPPIEYFQRSYTVVDLFPLGTGSTFISEDADGDGGPGDGRIDMGDFRRWRDWLLADELVAPSFRPQHGLNGSGSHAKRDANRNSYVEPNEIELYPRGDFNGDGRMDRQTKRIVPGALAGAGNLTDLDVLMQSGLWQDTQYSAQDLPQLIDSVDLTVWASNFFGELPAANSAEVEVYDAHTRGPLAASGAVTFSRAEPVQMFTVPTELEVYVASRPIDVGDGTNVMMRSIGDLPVPFAVRGLDYVLDLASVEMTAVVEVEELGERVIDSRPDAAEVDAQLEAANGMETAFGHDYAGARAWANEDGTFYTLARTGSLPGVFNELGERTTFKSGVRWQRSFVKVDGLADPTFEVKPMELVLVSGGPQGQDLEARAEILVESRLSGQSGWTTNFYQRAEIAGANTVFGVPTYRIVEQEGFLPNQDLELQGVPLVDGAIYRQVPFQGEIGLDAIAPGESFEVRYTLTAEAVAYGLDQYAAAWIGDPLDYGSGARMAYGDFGELPRIKSLTTNAPGQRTLTFCSRTNFYYRILRRDVPDGPWTAIGLVLGAPGQTQFVDRAAPPGADAAWYALENQPIDQPLDQDQDGINDMFELRHATVLNPLDPSDALEDPDADQRTNWREYLDGTNPGVADPPRAAPADSYPARLLPAVARGLVQTADLNNDGHADLISVAEDGSGVQAELGEGFLSFLPPITSPIAEGGYFAHLLPGRFDADALTDLAVIDASNHRLHLLSGLGNGRFQLRQTLTTSNFPDRVVSGDFGGDGVLDLIVVSGGSRSISVYAGQGDGTFQARPGLALPFRPGDAILASFNGDAQADLAVTLLSSQVAVYPGLGNGTFGVPQFFATGFEPGRLAAGRLNGDAHVDLVVANRVSDDLSVLLGNGNNTFQAELRVPAGNSPQQIAIADLTGDGHADVLVSHGADYQLLLPGTGGGMFGAPTTIYTESASDFLLTDVTEDGRLDLLVPVVDGLALARGGASGQFEARREWVIPSLSPVDFDLADLNADGRLDALIANQRSNSVEVLLGQPGGTFGSPRTVAVAGQVVGMVVGLLDAGSSPDMAVTTAFSPFASGPSSNQLHVLLGDGSGGFNRQPPIALPEPPGDVFAGDVNGDGRVDLLVQFVQSGQLAAYLRQADGSYLAGPVLEVGFDLFQYAVQDLNGDSRADLIVSPTYASEVGLRVFHGAADGSLAAVQEIVAENGSALTGFALADRTGDGQPDLIVGTDAIGGPQVSVRTGQADGRFGAASALELPEYNGGPLTAQDVNADGQQDFVAQGRLWFGPAPFGRPEAYWIGGSLPVLVRDLNGDQRPELIAVDDQSDSFRVLYHR